MNTPGVGAMLHSLSGGSRHNASEFYYCGGFGLTIDTVAS